MPKDSKSQPKYDVWKKEIILSQKDSTIQNTVFTNG